MKKEIKNGVEKYQCPGCILGNDIKCYKKPISTEVSCENHAAGTLISSIGKIFLGMPKGFNRLGSTENLKIVMFEKFEDCYWNLNKWNIPVWKHLNKNGHTLVRELSPRTNNPFIHIFLEDCLNKINCLEINSEDINSMD